MKRWKVTVTMESTLPAHVDDGGAEVETVWLRAGDELSALESVIQNMRSDEKWVRVTKITVEPVRMDSESTVEEITRIIEEG